MDFRVRYRNNLVELGDGGKVEDLPFIGLAGHEAGKIIHVDALHDDDDGAGAFVVEAGQQGVLEPFVAGVAFGLGIGVVGLQGIVDNDHVAAATGQRAPDRCRQAEPARGEFDLGLSVLERSDPRVREGRSIPRRFEHRAEVVGMLFGKVGGIADADDASRRITPQDESRKGHRGRYRF